MIVPANETSIYGWDFPWQTVSHNQMVDVHSDFPVIFQHFTPGFYVQSTRSGQQHRTCRPCQAPGQFHHLLWTFFWGATRCLAKFHDMNQSHLVNIWLIYG